jgi:hypothetical protein
LSRIRLYIATSEGPVRVQRILAEDAVDDSEPSAVCLNGTHTRLGITKGYTYFVRDHVRSFTGKGVYRMDLDARVDGGNSWMLGVWISHVLQHMGRLAIHDDEAELAVFATGAIAFGAGADRALEVRKVGHIPDKVRLMVDRMGEEAAAGRRVLFITPYDNADEARAEIDKLPAALRDTLSFHDVTGADEVRAFVGLDESGGNFSVTPTATGVPAATAVVIAEAPVKRRRGSSMMIFLALLAGAAAAGGYAALSNYEDDWRNLWQQGRYADLTAALDAAPLECMADRFRASLAGRAGKVVPIVVLARRPEDGGSCAGLRFRKERIVEKPLAPTAAGGYVLDTPRTLCGFVVRAGTADTPARGRVWLALMRDGGDGGREAILPVRRVAKGGLASGPLSIIQNVPLYRLQPWSWRVVVMRTPGPSADIAKLFDGAIENPDPALLARLKTFGVIVTRVRISLSSEESSVPMGGSGGRRRYK